MSCACEMKRRWVKKKIAPLFHPVKSETKTIVTRFHAHISRASPQLQVLASSFDWLTELPVLFVNGQNIEITPWKMSAYEFYSRVEEYQKTNE